MKTLVLQLDRTEDTGSIRDKVTWGKASRVLLVWPVNFILLDRKIDLVTVKRICTSQGSRLGIVSDIPEIIAEAEELHIPVFDSVNRAMKKGWDRRKNQKTVGYAAHRKAGATTIEKLRIDKYKSIDFWKIDENLKIPVFLLAIIAVFTILVFLFPAADIIIYPQGRLSEMQMEFRIHESVGIASTPGMLAATKKTLKVNGETTVPSTGSLLVPDHKSSGKVTITNLTSSGINIPMGTVIQKLSNPPVRYKVLESISIPAKVSTAGIGIEAVEPGEDGNAVGNTITSLDGPLGLLVEVSNPDPVTGGSSKIYQAVSKTDAALTADKLQKILSLQAETEFTKILGDQEVLLPSSIQVVNVAEHSEQPEVGQAGALLKLKQTVEYSVLIINRQELENQADTLLQANQPVKGWVKSHVNPVEVHILSQKFDKETGSVVMTIFASEMWIPHLDTNSIQNQLAGKSKSRAIEIINGFVLNSKMPEILTLPNWMPFLPLLSSRIQVEVR